MKDTYLSITNKVQITTHIVKYILGYILSRFLNEKQKYLDVWLIAERQKEARDNGYHLFKFIRKNHSEINIYYVIDKQSVDFNKIAPVGNIVQFGSLKHYIFYFLSKKNISTHVDGYLPNYTVCKKLDKYINIKGEKIFLQHGIIKDFLPSLTKKVADLNLFVCGALPEYKYVKNNFGYKNDEVRYLGLCRFDELHDFEVKKQILIMPTYRADLFPYSSLVDNSKEKAFKNSSFFQYYQSLLNNTELINTLERCNVQLIFYPHYEIQKYLHLFSKDSEKIVFASKEEFDVQSLLKDSAVLITDYSSVFFDFGYMRKPVLYYQFDYEKYREIQYSEGYFSYENNGFGPVCKSEKNLVKNIINTIDNNFKIDKKYIRRTDDFFPLHDKSNCERNFLAILRM